jgi:hypothetical protein
MTMTTYNTATVEAIVNASAGRFFTVEFVKANGEPRKIKAQEIDRSTAQFVNVGELDYNLKDRD